MKWLEGLSKKQLEPSWRFEAAGVFWRLVPSSDGLLVGEDRQAEAKSVTFFCIDRKSGVPLWTGVAMDEHWWVGIEDVGHCVLFLHGYQSPDMPMHLGITALDLSNGKVLWRREELRYLETADDKVYAAAINRSDDPNIVEVDSTTGTIIREIDAELLMEVRSRQNERSFVRFPTQVRDAQAAPDVMKMILKRLPIDKAYSRVSSAGLALKQVSVLDVFDKRTADQASRSFRERLFVVRNADGKQLYGDVLSVQAAGEAVDSFFVIENTLYYIKERRTLIAVPLSPEETDEES